jgi:hypothetical protein
MDPMARRRLSPLAIAWARGWQASIVRMGEQGRSDQISSAEAVAINAGRKPSFGGPTRACRRHTPIGKAKKLEDQNPPSNLGSWQLISRQQYIQVNVMGESSPSRRHSDAIKAIGLGLLSGGGLTLLPPVWAQGAAAANPTTTATKTAATATTATTTDQPATATAAAGNAAGGDANTANNPLTVIPGFQVQNYYQPVLKDAPGSGATQPILRAIIPVEAFGGSNLLRLSLPVGTSTWGEAGSASGIGDLTVFNVRVFPLSSSAGFGVGPLLVAPTASAPELGLQKWQIGAQSTFSSHFKWGLLAALVSYQQPFDGSSNTLTVQPFIFRNLGKGFYLRSSGVMSFDTVSGNGVVPIGLGLGKVTRLASGNLLNVYIEPQLSAYANGTGQPSFQLFAGFNVQFPKASK